MNAKNVCVLLNLFYRMFNGEKIEQNFIDQCFEIIDSQTEKAFESSSFVDIDEETLKLILERETLNTRELSVFKACEKWSKHECERKNLEANPLNKRSSLNKLIYLIRIPTMSLDEFANNVPQSNLLTGAETTDLFLHYTVKNTIKNQANKHSIGEFNFKKRKGLDLYVCRRFQISKYHQLRFSDSKYESIQFAVDRKLFLVGFSIFGSYSICSVYKVKIELKKNDHILAQKNSQLVTDGQTRTFRLMFDHPIEIHSNQLYNASITLDGNSFSFYGQEGR